MDILICVVLVARLWGGGLIDRSAVQVSAKDEAHDAVVLGHTRDPALYDAFHSGYYLTPSGEVAVTSKPAAACFTAW